MAPRVSGQHVGRGFSPRRGLEPGTHWNLLEPPRTPGTPWNPRARKRAPSRVPILHRCHNAMMASASPVGFDSLGLNAQLVKALNALGYEEPTPVQRETIPLMLEGRDLLAQAATGTGKTAAFALPMLQRLGDLGPEDRRRTTGLILVPTRELAMQVAEAVHKYARGSRHWGFSFARRTVLVTGGSRGLGLVLARQLASEGARLALLARDAGDLALAAEDLRTRHPSRA